MAGVNWTIRDNVRAQLRVYVKRILRKYGYPPDKQEKATQTVLEQAALLARVPRLRFITSTSGSAPSKTPSAGWP